MGIGLKGEFPFFYNNREIQPEDREIQPEDKEIQPEAEARNKGFGPSQPLSATDHWLLGTITDALSGEKVSDEQSLQVSTVFACIKVLSETISTLPLKWYKKVSDDKREEYSDYFLAKLFRKPNKLQKKIGFIENIVAMLSLRGNYYGGKNYTQAGKLAEIISLKTKQMTPEVKDNEIIYKYINDKGVSKDYSADKIWHVKSLSLDGVVGLSPIEYARKSIRLSQHAENHGINYYKNGARTSGYVKVPGKLKEGMKEKMIKELTYGMTGDNKFKVMVFDLGAEWKETGISQEDSQYLETRRFSVEEICRFYRMPAVMIGHPDKTMTHSSSEQFMLSFVKFTLAPWLKRIEEAINVDLSPEEDYDKIYAEFSINGLLRGDTESRNKSYALGRQWGWLSVNDIRKKENDNPIENGDRYLEPVNMIEAGEDPPDVDDNKNTSPKADNEDDDDPKPKKKKKK